MSNFIAEAIHPVTLRRERAWFLDDYYGPHRYGVKFSDGEVYPESECEVIDPMSETEDGE